MRRRFRIAWQTVIGLVNVERGGKGQPQLELETSSDDGVRTVTGRYSIADARELSADSVDLYASLAPSMSTTSDRIVIATSDELSKRLVADDQAVIEEGSGGVVSLIANGKAIGDLLLLNRAALVGQNMLEKGHSREAAENEVDTLIGAVSIVSNLSAKVIVATDGLHGRIQLDWLE